MVRISELVRFLMLLTCLVPFASARQVGMTIAPGMPLAPINQAPVPVSEEEDERQTSEIKERIAAQARQRVPDRWRVGTMPTAHTARAAASPTYAYSPFDPDPFRNGLGTPFRC
jgi:hypothetical protein